MLRAAHAAHEAIAPFERAIAAAADDLTEVSDERLRVDRFGHYAPRNSRGRVARACFDPSANGGGTSRQNA